ncbi:uncharacterized protein MYCFIDRAFT_176355 [Pseudocercospora fijiensis CIRAD86]|uniref:Uncharacterized protein n=1 Tax=Pseudocercospora fijiensis (strain CIRAD86) TaxID=383855 RepID=M3AU41_PSEFD|nr:uncharacterized protein MYCFIDRAFT_176355 [Pseudocercospora fijiensis CIRAD86]EME81007.1 hypothetical protein MYCFIDRAFT_176355 [Pseudocercospora fijiensis CIRAD86]
MQTRIFSTVWLSSWMTKPYLGKEYLTDTLYPLTKLRKGIQVERHCRADDDADNNDENERYTHGLEKTLNVVWKSRDHSSLQSTRGQHLLHSSAKYQQRLEDFYHCWDRLISRQDERWVRKVTGHAMAIVDAQEPLEGAEAQWEDRRRRAYGRMSLRPSATPTSRDCTIYESLFQLSEEPVDSRQTELLPFRHWTSASLLFYDITFSDLFHSGVAYYMVFRGAPVHG